MEAIRRACEVLGSPAELARAVSVKSPTLHQWLTGRRPVPIERCVDVERATKREVMRWHLRPGDWHRIWPELIGTEGAPPVPASADAAAKEAA